MWIEAQEKAASSASSLPPSVRAVLCLAVILGVASQICEGQTTIAAKRNRDFYVSLLDKSGKLMPGKNEYCASFSRTTGGGPAQVEDVFVDLAQQVGKIRESPRKFPFSMDSVGRYCGTVDFGQQYYQPASYYVIVHYTDSSQKRRTCRFFLTLK